ncbi:MAG: 16S rRNA processing protein RimM [Bacilli bacterium]|nr:16S rRNA processing protein RimM [Bacilli bacterium]
MTKVYVGKIVNTHGIKGELRLLSDFDYKERIFVSGSKIFIGTEYQKEIIKSYRRHKKFDMIELEGYQNINEVLAYVGKKVYCNREDLYLNQKEYLLEDLLHCHIIENRINYGEVTEIVYNNNNILLKVKYQNKFFYIPKQEYFIEKININEKKIYVNHVKGLIL